MISGSIKIIPDLNQPLMPNDIEILKLEEDIEDDTGDLVDNLKEDSNLLIKDEPSKEVQIIAPITEKEKSNIQGTTNLQKEASELSRASQSKKTPQQAVKVSRAARRAATMAALTFAASTQLYLPVKITGGEEGDKLESWRTINLLFAAIKCTKDFSLNIILYLNLFFCKNKFLNII